jgi:hypothetical protein
MNAIIDTTKLANIKKAIPTATQSEIVEYVASKIPAISNNFLPIETSNIDLKEYRLEDADINAVFTDMGWTNISLVDEQENIVPNARLKVTLKSGNSFKIIPFFPLVLLARKSTIELSREAQLKTFSEQNSMKARGNTYKFAATPEQLDAMAAKAELQREIDIKTTVDKFNTWLNDFHPTVGMLPALYTAFTVSANLVVIGSDIFIRQNIAAGSDIEPLENEALTLLSSNEDKIGDVLLSTQLTYKLVA